MIHPKPQSSYSPVKQALRQAARGFAGWWTLPRAGEQNPGRWTPSDAPPQALGLGWVAVALALAASSFDWAQASILARASAQWPGAPRCAWIGLQALAWLIAVCAVVALPEAIALCRKSKGGEGFARGWALGAVAWARAWAAGAAGLACLAAAVLVGAWVLLWKGLGRGDRFGFCGKMAGLGHSAANGLTDAVMRVEEVWEPTRIDFLNRQGLGAQWLAWKRKIRGPEMAIGREEKKKLLASGLPKWGESSERKRFEWALKSDYNPFWAPKKWEPSPPRGGPKASAFMQERSVFFVEDCLRAKIQASFQDREVALFRSVQERLARLAEKMELQSASQEGSAAGSPNNAEQADSSESLRAQEAPPAPRRAKRL